MSDCSNSPTYTWNVNYVIWFTDAEEYGFAVGVMGGNSFQKNPEFVAGTLNVPIYDGPVPPGPNGWNEGFAKGMFCLSYPGFNISGGGVDVGNPGQTVLLSPFSDFVHVSCFDEGGLMTWANRDVYWSGSIVLMTPAPPVPQPDTDATIPKRRWITGFESEFGAEGSGNSGLVITRDASRTINGLGSGIRRSTNKNFTRTTAQYITGITPDSSWERFYIRVRKFDPTNRIDIWKCDSFPSSSSGIRLYINIDGSINVYNVNSFAVETLLTTTAVIFTQDVFVRLDLLINYNPLSSSGSGRFRLYINGTATVDEVVAAASGGIGQNSTYHLQSRLGTQILVAVNVWEIDLDDWICSDIPTATVDSVLVETLTSVDWLGGTHVKLVRNTTATTIGWTGTPESTNQMMSPINASTSSRLTSSTAQAEIHGTTELNEGLVDFSGYQIAAVSAVFSKYGTRGSSSGKLGYNLAGAGDILTSITETVGAQYNSVMYPATGTDITPPEIFPLDIVYQKGNDSSAGVVYAVQATVEYIGLWGVEDNPLVPQLPSEKFLIHNGAYYANSPWGGFTPGEGLVCVHSGTYTGNGTEQTIEVSEVPIHFLFVRPLTGGTKNGFRWFATGLGGHIGAQEGVAVEAPTTVYFDPDTLTVKFIVAGSNAECNANGVTYQWVVFADPTTRYNICGAFLHSTTTTGVDNPLFNETFTPEAVFTQNENTISAATNVRLAYKGPGNGANDGQLVDNTALSDYITFGTGLLTSGINAHRGNQTTYSAWRTDDGTDDVMVQITSYNGDGTGNRDISLIPASLRYPGFAVVIPHSGATATIFRDPSHTGANSGQINGSSNTVANGIIGGNIDILQVGSALNANAVVYDVFVIPGVPTGWSQFDWCSNMEGPPIWPPPPPVLPPNIAILPEGGLILGASGGVPTTLLVDPTGIYKYVPGSMCDLIYDRSLLVTIDFPIPAIAKGGYIGG